jgi:hypothetical protein
MESSAKLIRKARLFDFYSRRVWRMHRLLVRTHLTPRCRRCVKVNVVGTQNGLRDCHEWMLAENML